MNAGLILSECFLYLHIIKMNTMNQSRIVELYRGELWGVPVIGEHLEK